MSSSSLLTGLVAPLLSLCPRPCSETLPVEYLGGKPLCMNQYYQILSSCRVPGPKQDTVISFSKTKKPPMHITVVHNYQVGGLPACCRKSASPAAQGHRPPGNWASPPPAYPHKPSLRAARRGPWSCPAWGRARQGPPPLSYL